MSVAIVEGMVWVRITGRANFAASVDFKALIHGLRGEGFGRFIFDVSDCVIMDSTFLGVLAGFVAALTQPGPANDGACVQLLNPNQRINDLLDNLGIAPLFNVVSKEAPAAGVFKPVIVGENKPDREEVSRTCLEAHETLMEINPDNVTKFKDVAKFLAEDLKRLQKKASDPASPGSTPAP